MKKCCGFCKHYEPLQDGVTEYRGHVVTIGYCPMFDDLEELDRQAQTHDPKWGNWDEEYRWASHVECNAFEPDEISMNDPANQYLRDL